MAGKTHTELIRELTNTATTLVERVDNMRRDINRIDDGHAKTGESLNKAATQLTVLEEKLTELKKDLQESERKRWALTLALVVAFLGLVANIALSLLRK